jgi:hypothetical protein
MRAQNLELIYSQSGLLYKVLPDAPQSILDKTRHKSGPHVDGIVGSTNCNNCRYSKQWLAQLLVQMLPLFRRQMYTVCN